jgi:predicted DNA-binding protein with PD1-like motif
MESRWINQNPKTLAIIFATGDEVTSGLKQVAIEHQLTAAQFTAIGAFSEMTLGFFDLKRKDYKKIVFNEQMEVLSLIGDISLNAGEPQIHAHLVAGRADATTRGGHLLRGIVSPTLEVILTVSPAHLNRKYDPEIGLALIDLKATT